MEWINEKAKTLKQGAIRAMFDRANTMTGVISLGIGEPDMPTPKLVCEACKEALDKGITHYTPNAGTLSFRQAIAEKSYLNRVGIVLSGELEAYRPAPGGVRIPIAQVEQIGRASCRERV